MENTWNIIKIIHAYRHSTHTCTHVQNLKFPTQQNQPKIYMTIVTSLVIQPHSSFSKWALEQKLYD